jgi:hypothetical protein
MIEIHAFAMLEEESCDAAVHMAVGPQQHTTRHAGFPRDYHVVRSRDERLLQATEPLLEVPGCRRRTPSQEQGLSPAQGAQKPRHGQQAFAERNSPAEQPNRALVSAQLHPPRHLPGATSPNCLPRHQNLVEFSHASWRLLYARICHVQQVRVLIPCAQDLTTFQSWFDFDEDLHGEDGGQRIIGE